MNKAQLADTGAERLLLFQRMRFLDMVVSDIKAEQASRESAYSKALRTCARVKAAIGTSTPRRSVKACQSSEPLIVRPGDPGFAEAERQWKAQRARR